MTPRTLPPRLRRALEHRVGILEAEQREAAEEHEALYERSNRILAEMISRQQTLRVFRDILLNFQTGQPDAYVERVGRAA